MYLRYLFKFILAVYWFLFAYLASRIIMDWNSILGAFDSVTQLFILFMTFLGIIILPYLIVYWRKLNPVAQQPALMRIIAEKMDYLEDIHSLWYEVLLVVKYIGLFICGMWAVSVILSTLIIVGWGIALVILSCMLEDYK
ncbi:hypothetical protein [Veillonella caviae]|uniref:hypothetical protein n=1 Tax=Veillonella caviae TaxID=248316 RepID=UPI0023A87C82|nr:hypothetical protein [Veillonella caviae]MCI5708321.1 hypothetical protein [Veillonella caviae]MCI6407199.1 hypothetical protein [Veillonella caviae]MDY6224727.1 hypothetical protein [Veillonella caviae]